MNARSIPSLARAPRLESAILSELRVARALAWLLYRQPRLAACLFRRHGQALCEFVTDVAKDHIVLFSAVLACDDRHTAGVLILILTRVG